MRLPELPPWLHRAVGRDGSREWLLAASFALALLAGWTFRLAQYVANRSLWYDESQLALNILHHSVVAVTQKLDLAQTAPTVFLVLEKLATDGFGKSEYALRLVPLLCGLASVPLFVALSRRVLEPPASVVGALLFACAAGPIYYASEVKQYSGDVFAALVLSVLGLALLRSPTSGRTAVIAVVGALVVLLSHASVLVAGGISFVLGARFVARRAAADRGAFLATFPWLASALFVTLLTVTRARATEAAINSDSSAYLQTSSPHTILDWPRSLVSALTRLMGIPDTGTGAGLHWVVYLLALVGLVSLGLRRPVRAALLLSPGLPLVVAAALHRYPLFDRTVLFLVPAAILFAAEGVGAVMRLVPTPTASRLAAAGAALVLLVVPVGYAVKHLYRPRQHEEIKSVLSRIRDEWRRGDAFFVEADAQPSLRYYLDCGCFRPAELSGSAAWRFVRLRLGAEGDNVLGSRRPDFVVGRAPAESTRGLLREVATLRGRRRVWILYTHLGSERAATTLEHDLPLYLDRIGRRLDELDAYGAHAYLYDLR